MARISAISSLGWRRRSRVTPTWPTSSICSPTCSEIRGDDSFRVGRLPARRRRGSARRPRRWPSSRSTGRAKELQGIGKTIEEKIVQIVQDGEIHALTKRKAASPGRGRPLHAPPGPRPEDARGRSGRSSAITTLEELREAAEAQRLRDAAGHGREDGGERAHGARRSRRRPRSRAARCSGRALPALRAVVSVLAEHPACDAGLDRGQRAALQARPSATSTSSRPPTTRPR